MTEPLPLDLDALDLGCPPAVMTPAARWEWRCWVPGVPRPQGSKDMMPIYKGRGKDRVLVKWVLVESSDATLRKWRKEITTVAGAAWTVDPCDVPMHLGCAFLIPPWKSTREGDWPVGSTIGDLSHLTRAVEDGLKTAGVIKDDRLIVGMLGAPDTSKRFARPGEGSGVQIILRPAPPIPGQWRGFRPPVKHRVPR